ncbi:hypothetical protein VCSRO66_2884 [Vibrio cholerae]|nr:hypothetical protein VCSRO66_2884 [Vibrio cholerae]
MSEDIMSEDIMISTTESETPQENPIETLRIYDLEHGVGYKKVISIYLKTPTYYRFLSNFLRRR